MRIPYSIGDDDDFDPEPRVFGEDLGRKQIEDWGVWGARLERKSSELAFEFYRSTIPFLENKKGFQIPEWARDVLEVLDAANGSESAAIAYLRASPQMYKLFPITGFREWKKVGLLIAAKSDRHASEFFDLWPETMDTLYPSDVKRVLDVVALLRKHSLDQALDFYRDAPQLLSSLNPNVRESAMQAVIHISKKDPKLITRSFRIIASALGGLSNPAQELVMRHEPAVRAISLEAVLAYFRNAESVIDSISEMCLERWIGTGILLGSETIAEAEQFFALESQQAKDWIKKWTTAVQFEDVQHVLSIFAHALTGRPLTLACDDAVQMAPTVASTENTSLNARTIMLPTWIASENSEEANFRLYKVAVAHHAGYIEFDTFAVGMQHIASFLQQFPDRHLAAGLFFLLEDGRIDARLKLVYRGLAPDIAIAHASFLARTPRNYGNLLEESLDLLLRLSMGDTEQPDCSKELVGIVETMTASVARLHTPESCVADTMEITTELYQAICTLMPKQPYSSAKPPEFWERPEIDLESGSAPASPDPDEILPADDVGSTSTPLSPEELQKILELLKEVPLPKNNDAGAESEGLCVTGDNIEGDEYPEEFFDRDVANRDAPMNLDGPEKNTRAGPFYYDEWDYLQDGYRRKWCCLREERVPPKLPEVYDHIYEQNRALIQKVRYQFQQIKPEDFETISRTDPGDELHLTSVVENIIDRKAGSDPSDKIFSRKERKIRRVSTLLLIDMSASTSQQVPTSDGDTDDESPPSKRIIDIEIESLVVMTEALEALGDEYAIYGFSGRSRHAVEYFVVKDFGDKYSRELKHRIGGITPKQGTRMGPAIRHATEKLRAVEADHRLMILLSDGFPQDTDYGEDRTSKEYGLHDTRMALLEARKADIRPFCLTVDQTGNDYLRKMCDPTSYLIVEDIYSLPEVLPRVVESLIT